MERLRTFVHISDLHIGDPNHDSFDAETQLLWSLHPVFDGLLGHSAEAMLRLEEAFFRLKEEEGARLIVTGDLTAIARDEQFDTCERYLEATIGRPGDRSLGLREGAQWKSLSIPGNHDHWPGRARVFGGPTDRFRRLFPADQLPSCDEVFDLGENGKLRFIRLNSDASVSPIGARRFFARGAFLDQLKTIEERGLLANLEEAEVRVLLLHHSPAHEGFVLGMQRASRDALRDFIATKGISLVLTGHNHVPLLHPHRIEYKGVTFSCLECRCGTTTQRTEIPYSWRARSRNKRNGLGLKNSLLVHRIYGDGNRLEWEVEAHALNRADGFRLAPVYPLQEVSRARWVLWPPDLIGPVSPSE